jgi:hypothetical protein
MKSFCDIRYPWRFSGLALLVLSPLTLAQQPALGFGDCSVEALTTLRSRVLQEGKLRPIIVTKDVAQLSACEGASSGSVYDRTVSTLSRDYVVEIREVKIAPESQGPLADSAREICGKAEHCDVEIYRRRDYDTPLEIPFAKSGGLPFAQFLGHLGQAGHFEITGQGARATEQRINTRWTPEALKVLQDASRDADFYDWSNPAAHAQTPNDDVTGKISGQSQDAAKAAFVGWTQSLLAKSVAACRDSKYKQALYLLGYALHGPQDLVFHEGITNAEHSFRDFVEKRQIDAVDHFDEKRMLAVEATRQMLLMFRSKVDLEAPGCWSNLVMFSGDTTLYAGEREALLGKPQGKDFGIFPYLDYQRLATQVKEARFDAEFDPAQYFIKDHWLGGRQPIRLLGFVNAIFGVAAAQEGESK